MSTLDEDLYSTLTPEEQEAIKEAEYSPEELEAMKKLASDGAGDADGEGAADTNDGEGNEAGDGAGGGDGEAVEKAQDGKTPAAGEDAGAAGDDSTEAKVQGAKAEAGDAGATEAKKPVAAADAGAYRADLPQDYETRRTALDGGLAEAWKKFDAGELDRDGLQKRLSELQTERAALDAIAIKAEISQEMTQQTAQQRWQTAINTAFNEFVRPDQGGVDYRKDTAKAADLDAFVKVLASDERNADKSMDWFLAEAHKRVMALHGVARPQQADAEKKAPTSRKPDVSAAPKTLATVAGGDGPGDVGSEFAQLDSLDGDALEDAIARMTPQQRTRYLRGV